MNEYALNFQFNLKDKQSSKKQQKFIQSLLKKRNKSQIERDSLQKRTILDEK